MMKGKTAMLKKLSDCQLSEGDFFTASLLRGWCALDTESGAFLQATRGRGKGGLSKYVLILPTKTPAERGGVCEPYEWNDEDRKFIRAWSEAGAIDAANVRLEKMLVARESAKAPDEMPGEDAEAHNPTTAYLRYVEGRYRTS